MIKIASWNVNSLRARLDHVQRWLSLNPVDILCLQETKVSDPQFPQQPWLDLGYHCAIFGQKAYNGVAIVSREELHDVHLGFTEVLGPDLGGSFDQQKRVITARYGDTQLVNLYVPNGADVVGEKYEYKLAWFKTLEQYLQCLLDRNPRVHLCGDFNIALADQDIYKNLGNQPHIMASEPERSSLRRILDLGFADPFRRFHPEPNQFSWWDYRAASFTRNHGWRIDHHYLSTPLQERVLACDIDTTPRGWDRPSDHAPVVLEIQGGTGLP